MAMGFEYSELVCANVAADSGADQLTAGDRATGQAMNWIFAHFEQIEAWQQMEVAGTLKHPTIVAAELMNDISIVAELLEV